jgi:hypothetical protein
MIVPSSTSDMRVQDKLSHSSTDKEVRDTMGGSAEVKAESGDDLTYEKVEWDEWNKSASLVA